MEERQRLARELHDSVTQTLFSASIIADALPILVSTNSLKLLPYLDDLRNLTRGALAEMRSLLIELRPEALERTQLGVLLAQLCEVFTGQTQIEVQQTIARDIILRPAMKIIFYRIAQEGLHNIAKHAHAQHVSLILHDVDDIVEMRIKDDGKGFLGTHSATDTFYKWPEYGDMIGGYFDDHPWTQEVTINDAGHASSTSRSSSPPTISAIGCSLSSRK